MARLLSRGMTGLDVNELQAALNFHVRAPAVPLDPDGNFGPLTEARVRDFQKRAKIVVDGLVGPNTIAALYRRIKGALDVTVTPRSTKGPAGVRSPAGFRPGFRQLQPSVAQLQPTNPDSAAPQIRSAKSEGFELQTKLTFNPLAKPSEGENPFVLKLSKEIPWPVFLPKPLELEVEAGTGEKFELDGKIKFPFELIATDRFELKPYFFVGAGVGQNNFKDLNAGGGASLSLKIFKDIGGTGASFGLEADGGFKYTHDIEKNEGTAKGFLETTGVLTVPLPF